MVSARDYICAHCAPFFLPSPPLPQRTHTDKEREPWPPFSSLFFPLHPFIIPSSSSFISPSPSPIIIIHHEPRIVSALLCICASSLPFIQHQSLSSLRVLAPSSRHMPFSCSDPSPLFVLFWLCRMGPLPLSLSLWHRIVEAVVRKDRRERDRNLLLEQEMLPQHPPPPCYLRCQSQRPKRHCPAHAPSQKKKKKKKRKKKKRCGSQDEHGCDIRPHEQRPHFLLACRADCLWGVARSNNQGSERERNMPAGCAMDGLPSLRRPMTPFGCVFCAHWPNH